MPSGGRRPPRQREPGQPVRLHAGPHPEGYPMATAPG